MKMLLVLVYLIAATQAKPPPPDLDAKRPHSSDRVTSVILPQNDEVATLVPAAPRMALSRGTHVLDEGNYTIESVTRQCSCGIPNRSSRIVGGVETEVNEYPWQVGLVSAGGSRTWCGGTLINNRYVLTAAHCTVRTRPSSIQVLIREHRIGQSDGEIRATVASILIHPRYKSPWRTGYDFSLLKLSDPVDFPDDNRVAPTCLPAVASNMYVGSDAVVTGWGSTSSGGSQAITLQEVTVPVVSNDVCSNSYKRINPTMICAGLSEGGKDSCQGDSGGPMVTLEGDRYSLIGVVSWGTGCALPGYPGVYARVTSVIDWIQDNTSDATYCN